MVTYFQYSVRFTASSSNNNNNNNNTVGSPGHGQTHTQTHGQTHQAAQDEEWTGRVDKSVR